MGRGKCRMRQMSTDIFGVVSAIRNESTPALLMIDKMIR
jgi:hypothetical protein